MPSVKKPPHDRAKHFLRDWRNQRGLSQEDVAERVEISRSLLSKIENGVVPYNQDLLERLAETYNATPSDLISRSPMDEPEWSIFDLPAGDAERVKEFVRALRISRSHENARPADAENPKSEQRGQTATTGKRRA